MDSVEKCVCFTGHRELGSDVENIRNDVKRILIRLIATGVRMCICGGALGFDLLCGEVVMELKEQCPDLRLVMAIPCPEQDRYYPIGDKKRYERLIAESETVLCSRGYHRYCMMRRNQFMVDHAKYLVCYLRKPKGGTYQTRSYAEMKRRQIFDI